MVVQKELSVAKIRRNSARKSFNVSFGPPLSPEYFNENLPVTTPLKRGSLPFQINYHVTPVNVLSNKPMTPLFYEHVKRRLPSTIEEDCEDEQLAKKLKSSQET